MEPLAAIPNVSLAATSSFPLGRRPPAVMADLLGCSHPAIYSRSGSTIIPERVLPGLSMENWATEQIGFLSSVSKSKVSKIANMEVYF
jgi:hypothetical protein